MPYIATLAKERILQFLAQPIVIQLYTNAAL